MTRISVLVESDSSGLGSTSRSVDTTYARNSQHGAALEMSRLSQAAAGLRLKDDELEPVSRAWSGALPHCSVPQHSAPQQGEVESRPLSSIGPHRGLQCQCSLFLHRVAPRRRLLSLPPASASRWTRMARKATSDPF